MEPAKPCLNCDKPIKGRTDKKFCNEYCRNNYNNLLRSYRNNEIRNINNALGKNRRILESLIPLQQEMQEVSKETLLSEGFQFKYVTEIQLTPKGTKCHLCYDYGYIRGKSDNYLLIKKNHINYHADNFIGFVTRK